VPKTQLVSNFRQLLFAWCRIILCESDESSDEIADESMDIRISVGLAFDPKTEKTMWILTSSQTKGF
jgi:hypothetical protein